MPVEPVGISLAAVSLFFQVYDNCRRLYDGFENIRRFGREAGLQLARLQVIQWDLDTLMETKTDHLRFPPDLDDVNHPVTKQIIQHLRIILTYFKSCNKIIGGAFENSGYTFGETDGSITPASTDSTAPSAAPDPPNSTLSLTEVPSSTSHSSERRTRFLGVGRVLRGLSPMGSSRKSRNRSAFIARSRGESTASPSSFEPAQLDGETVNAMQQQIPLISIGRDFVTEYSMQDEASMQRRATASWWTLIKWADHNRTALDQGIERLRGSVRDFRQFLELREPREPGRHLDVANLAAGRTYASRLPPRAVEALHEALKRINCQPLIAKSFSISIAESCADNRRAIIAYPGVEEHLRVNGDVFFLQKQETDPHCTFVAIEAGPVDEPNTPNGPVITDVAAIVPTRASIDDCVDLSGNPEHYMFCGRISTGKDKGVSHHCFVEVKSWQKSSTLSDYLDGEEFRALLTPLTLIDIFRTILIAYLDFTRIRHVCRYPRLEDYVTYSWPRYDDDLNVSQPDLSDIWKIPYWSCGIGTPPPRRIPGASRSEREPDEAIVRLALVLFQLCTKSKSILNPLPSGAGKTWQSLKLEALSRFEEVCNLCGLQLASVVETCLQADAHTDEQVICRCLAGLENLKVEFQAMETT